MKKPLMAGLTGRHPLRHSPQNASGFDSGMVTHEKVRENRLRQMAKPQRLRASKSPRRDPRAYDYGRWFVTDTNGRRVLGGPELISA